MTLSSGTSRRQREVYGPLRGGGAHKLNVLRATARSGPARGKRLLEMTSVQFVAVHGLNYLTLSHVEVRIRVLCERPLYQTRVSLSFMCYEPGHRYLPTIPMYHLYFRHLCCRDVLSQ